MTEFNKNKLRELVLYIAAQSEDDSHFGATKLNKLLFFSDFLAYARGGAPITGATYRRMQFGPVPQGLDAIQRNLVEEGRAAVNKRERYGYQQQRLVALTDPDLSLFSGREVAIVNMVLEWLRDENAVGASAISHRELGWKQAAHGEEIPYFTAFLSTRPLTDDDIAQAQKFAADDGLAV